MCRCARCAEEGRTRVATEVDHVVSRVKGRALGWTEERIESDDNLQAINAECHKRKTQEEMGKSFAPKIRIGMDGFPVRKVAG